jgi:serine/threonine-protein kinase
MLPGITDLKILSKVLSKEPSQRYRTADQLGRVLMNFGDVRTAPALSLTPEIVDYPLTDSISQAAPASAAAARIDWITIGLGMLAMVAVLGLIPFWMWIYFVYNPPIR